MKYPYAVIGNQKIIFVVVTSNKPDQGYSSDDKLFHYFLIILFNIPNTPRIKVALVTIFINGFCPERFAGALALLLDDVFSTFSALSASSFFAFVLPH